MNEMKNGGKLLNDLVFFLTSNSSISQSGQQSPNGGDGHMIW